LAETLADPSLRLKPADCDSLSSLSLQLAATLTGGGAS
jgi:hypothetical protein